jgi:hypothetical protein
VREAEEGSGGGEGEARTRMAIPLNRGLARLDGVGDGRPDRVEAEAQARDEVSKDSRHLKRGANHTRQPHAPAVEAKALHGDCLVLPIRGRVKVPSVGAIGRVSEEMHLEGRKRPSDAVEAKEVAELKGILGGRDVEDGSKPFVDTVFRVAVAELLSKERPVAWVVERGWRAPAANKIACWSVVEFRGRTYS